MRMDQPPQSRASVTCWWRPEPAVSISLNLLITLLFSGIAFGIYRRSRAAALAMFIIFAAMRVRFYGLR